jgi:hypothetical protein
MPIVDPGNPGNSYLFYKLLREPRNFLPELDARSPDCASSHLVELPGGACPLPDEAERLRLAEWFVVGEPMPIQPESGSRSLLRSGLDAVHAWIASGAECP